MKRESEFWGVVDSEIEVSVYLGIPESGVAMFEDGRLFPFEAVNAGIARTT